MTIEPHLIENDFFDQAFTVKIKNDYYELEQFLDLLKGEE